MEKKHKKALLLFSVLFCVGLVLIPKRIYGAVLYLAPDSQTICQGDSFLVELRVDSEGEEINTIKADLMFPSNLLGAIDFSKGGSILTLWVEEPVIKNGEISFLAGRPGGFKGDGLIGKITFQGKETGEAEINFKENSQVLLHDGKGTPAKVSFSEGNYEIVKKPEGLPVVISQSHPDPNNWYRETTLSLYWELKEEAEYSWILSYDAEAEPNEIPDRPEPKEGLVWMGAMGYENLKDGIYYFHLKEKLLGQDWSEKVTLRAMIDSTPPVSFQPEIGQSSTVFMGKYFLSFVTVDEMSGIDHYEVSEIKIQSLIEQLFKKEEEGEWKIAETLYLLEDQDLRSKIFVKAVDKTGNSKVAQIIPAYQINWKDVIAFIILLLIGKAIWVIMKKIRTRQIQNRNEH